MAKRAFLIAVVLGCTAVVVGGCGGDSGTNGDEPDPFKTIHFDLYSVAPLGDHMVYELWGLPVAQELAAADNAWISLSKFNVIFDGDSLKTVDVEGNLIPGNDLTVLRELTAFDSLFVTVEPSDDTDTLPSGSVYLAGDIDFSKSVTVRFEFPDPDLRNLDPDAYLTFTTPTDTDTSNELSGVWFMLATHQRGLLRLESAPSGWIYQGWAEYKDTILSTGRFAEATGNDMDSAYSSLEVPAPGFPGEDFLNNLPSHDPENPFKFGEGARVWITVEPYPDPDPSSPFPYTIYETPPALTPVVGQNHKMDKRDESNGGSPVIQAVMSRGSS